MKPLERALIDAAEEGDLESLNLILGNIQEHPQVGDINCTNERGKTALHYTIEGNSEKHHPCFMRLLEAEGIRADIFDENGRTALHTAIDLEETEFDYFEQLTTRQIPLAIDQHREGTETPPALTFACKKKHLTQARKLIELGADLYATMLDASFANLFIWLVEENDAETVELFLQHGINALDIDLHRKDPYLTALSKKNTETLKVLMRFGYGIARDLTEDFLNLEEFQDDFYWLVGSRVTGQSLTSQNGRFKLAFISQEDLTIAREQLGIIRGKLLTKQALTKEQQTILLRRMEVEWRQWNDNPKIQNEIENLYYVLKLNQSIEDPEQQQPIDNPKKFEKAEYDYLFDIPYKKLLKSLKSDTDYDHGSLLRYLQLNQRGSLATQASELINQHSDLTTIKQALLFLDAFQRDHAMDKPNEELKTSVSPGKQEESDEEDEITDKKEAEKRKLLSLSQKLIANYQGDHAPTDSQFIDFSDWRDKLETNEGISVTNEDIDALIQDQQTLIAYFQASETFSRIVESFPQIDKTQPLQNTLLTLNQWIEQINRLKEAYINDKILFAKPIFYVCTLLIVGLIIFLSVKSHKVSETGSSDPFTPILIVSFLLLLFFSMSSIKGCCQRTLQLQIDIYDHNNIINRKTDKMSRFFLPASLRKSNFIPLQGLQKILLTLRDNYLNLEDHQSLLRTISKLTQPSCYLTINQTEKLLSQLQEELQPLTHGLQQKIDNMDTEQPQAITLPARFTSVCFFPEIKNLGELSPEYTRKDVIVEIDEDQAQEQSSQTETTATESTPLLQ